MSNKLIKGGHREMNITKGIFVLVLGLISVWLILAFVKVPEAVIAFSVIYLAAVIAAKSSYSNKN